MYCLCNAYCSLFCSSKSSAIENAMVHSSNYTGHRRKSSSLSTGIPYKSLPSLARVQRIIGFDKIYRRGEGPYLWDVDGNRYLDLLSGFGTFNLGRNHPVVRQAISDVLTADRPNLVKMDCPLLAGVLAEELVKRMPQGLD